MERMTLTTASRLSLCLLLLLLPAAAAGETKKVTADFSFNTGKPESGEKLTVVLKIYGKEEKATFKVK